MNIDSKANISKFSIIEGNVTIGENSSVFSFVTLRADNGPIVIGEGTNIQESCTVHMEKGGCVVLGDHVTIGHNAVIHGAKVGDCSLIGMGSILMDEVEVGKNCMIGAGSLLTRGTIIPDGMLALGSPAKVIRPLSEDEKKFLMTAALGYEEKGRKIDRG